MSICLDDLISHRFRGFSTRENSLEGLRAALAFGVKHLEFDIRVAACGTPMIYHDESAKDGRGRKRRLADFTAADYQGLGGDFPLFPTFEALLQAIVGSGNTQSRFLIDIKDAGFEVEIASLVRLYRLHDRVTYVSWVPEALYAMHTIEPDIALSFSHWCKSPGPLVRSVHKVFHAHNGRVPDSERRYIHGERSGWFVNGPVKGEMRNLLAASAGSVCVPVSMVSRALVDAYHDAGIEVSTFSYVELRKVQQHKKMMNIDLYFIDNKKIFDKIIL
ncbi:glycerophosphodiester phosphodiesterase [Robiginitomaculum antarcticum]|uniref:glycerophosphodiester phosphodiesterase n=1 Tax=Robiginitomaculum antarcticum TaxID=437507 RepID=UPI00037D6FBF|nr:glycerophosphodiester phosphodiesterase family protein [Robiginitomaculum antarcticum]